jgi:hypothetical protein
MGEKGNTYKVLIRKPERKKRPLRRPMRRWEDCVKMDVKEIGLEGFDWIHGVQWWCIVNTVIKIDVP